MQRALSLFVISLALGLGLWWLSANQHREKSALVLAEQAKASDIDTDEHLLQEAGLDASSNGLIALLRNCSVDDGDLLKLDEHIRQLGSRNFRDRETASQKLIALGLPAFSALERPARSPDLEVARRARYCLKRINGKEPVPLRAVVRLLARRKPNGATHALLRYLPSASDSELVGDIWYALDSFVKDSPDNSSVLAAALEDRLPARRAVAACILSRVGNQQELAAAKRLLADPDPTVRLRTAQGLLARRDPTGIPALIKLLTEVGIEQSWEAEELLHWAAAGEGPNATIGNGSSDQRRKCRLAWEAWWTNHRGVVDWDKVQQNQRLPGLLLIGEGKDDGTTNSYRLWLCGSDGTMRWSLENLRGIGDVQILPGGSILIVETSWFPRSHRKAGAHRVAEYQPDGKVVWEADLPDSSIHSRLLGSLTILVSQVRAPWAIVEVRPGCQEIHSFQVHLPDDAELLAVQKVDPERVLCLFAQGTGRELLLANVDMASGRVMNTRRVPIPLRNDAIARVEPVFGDRFRFELPARCGATIVHEISPDNHNLTRSKGVAVKPYAGADFDLSPGTKKEGEERIVRRVLGRLGFSGFELKLSERPDALVVFRDATASVRLGCEIQTLQSDGVTSGSPLREFESRWIRIVKRVFAELAKTANRFLYCTVWFRDPSSPSLPNVRDGLLIAELVVAGQRLRDHSSLTFPQPNTPTLNSILTEIRVVDCDGEGCPWWPTHLKSGEVLPLDDAIVAAVRNKGTLATSFDWQDSDERLLLLVAEARGLTDVIGGAREIHLPVNLPIPFTWVLVWDRFSEDLWTVFPRHAIICDGGKQKRSPLLLPARLQRYCTAGEAYPTKPKAR
jgi:hypothetical protein